MVFHGNRITVPYENSKQSVDGSTGKFVRRVDWRNVSPSMAVVEAVATATDREQQELDVLYDYIDPDALDRIFEDASGTNVEVTFTFEGTQVAVRSGGAVFVETAGGH